MEKNPKRNSQLASSGQAGGLNRAVELSPRRRCRLRFSCTVSKPVPSINREPPVYMYTYENIRVLFFSPPFKFAIIIHTSSA